MQQSSDYDNYVCMINLVMENSPVWAKGLKKCGDTMKAMSKNWMPHLSFVGVKL